MSKTFRFTVFGSPFTVNAKRTANRKWITENGSEGGF